MTNEDILNQLQELTQSEKEKAEEVKAKEQKCGVIEYLKAFNSLFEDTP